MFRALASVQIALTAARSDGASIERIVAETKAMHKSVEITKLIHENLSVVFMFAFGQPSARRVLQKHFEGGWKFLDRTIYEVSEQRADRALLEMATQLRILYDSDPGTEYIKHSFGKVVQGDGRITDLYFRDMTNKVIHGTNFEWDFAEENAPRIVIASGDVQRWREAQLNVTALMALGGMLAF